jgi:PhnB protein
MKTKTAFAPMLAISSGVTDIDFYKKAFGAVELWRVCNDDGSVHVAGFLIDDAMFHLHEGTPNIDTVSPGTIKGSPDRLKGVTTTIGLMVDDVHGLVAQAVAAGARVTSPVQDYDYGYRQGEIVDPFGHIWLIEKIFDESGVNKFKSK